MKKIILFLIFISSWLFVKSQQYFHLADSNAVWTVGISSIGEDPTLGCFWKFNIQGDTLINNLNYKIVYGKNYNNFQLNNSQYVGAIREENKKWFYIDSPTNIERLIYNFDLNVNDTITIYSYFDSMFFLDSITVRVINIDSTLINTSYRKRINVTKVGISGSDYWIEGIGSLRGLLFTRNCYGFDCGALLECYKENNNVVYFDTLASGSCDDINKIEVNQNDNEINITVFPIPVFDELQIETNSKINRNVMIEFYNSFGQNILKKPYVLSTYNNIIINLSEWNNGFYFLLIKTSNQIITKKIIRQ